MLEPSISSTFEQSPETAPLRGITYGHATHPGRLRDNNEDHLGAAPDLGFFVVADGVGGAPAGAVASRLATASMVCALRTSPGTDLSGSAAPESSRSVESHRSRMVAAAQFAHRMICDFATQNRCRGAATTMAALWVAGDRVHVANTGDSRVYRLAGGELEQLTKDHTAVQDHLEKHGGLAPRWARALENVVTQVLGGRSQRPPTVHLATRPLAGREVFLLCTDGLTKMVSDADIALVLGSSLSPQNAASVLVELANEAGGLDNITCVVVHVAPASHDPDAPPQS